MACREMKSKINKSDNLTPPLHPSDQWVPIGTGNYYKGEWNHRAMSGNGIYVVPDGTVYEGNFEDGLLHGTGTTYYPSGSRIEGVWEKGKCTELNYIFSDGLRFQPNNWQYCKMPDRRYAVEHVNGLEPADRSPTTNRQPTVQVPDDAYDAGDGFYRPLTNTVHDYRTGAPIRVPTAEDSKWIVENCRRGGDRVVGFRPEFYENWFKSGENVRSNSDTIPSDQIVNNDKSIMADIKTVPSTVFDLSLQNTWSKRKSALSVRLSPSSDQWLPSSSSRSPSVPVTLANCQLDRRHKPESIVQGDDDDRPSSTHIEPESKAMDKHNNNTNIPM